MVRLETGDTGVAVTADSDGALYSGMFGVDNYVVSTGNKFKAEIQSNNKIKISDGSAIMNGRHIRVPAGDSELVTINNGSQGMNRIDLIVLRYKKELTGVESGSLVVIQGEETASEPKAPDHVNGDILTGATQADFPLYEVKLEGINITDIKPLFQIIGNITELEKKFAELNGNCIKVVDSKSITTNGYNYEYSILSFGDKRYVKLFGNYTIKNVNGTSFPPFVYNTITNLGLFPVNITTKIKKVLDFSLNCFNPGSGLFLIGGIKKHIATTNAYADVQFLMTNPPQNIGLEWMMVCEIE